MPMTKEAAAKYLYDNVQVPVFFNRLAQWGFQPSNEDEARIMLKTASELVLLKEAETQVVHAQGQSMLQKAASLVANTVQEVYPQIYNSTEQQIAATVKFAAEHSDILTACEAIQQA